MNDLFGKPVLSDPIHGFVDALCRDAPGGSARPHANVGLEAFVG